MKHSFTLQFGLEYNGKTHFQAASPKKGSLKRHPTHIIKRHTTPCKIKIFG